jgi:hypothetical protein
MTDIHFMGETLTRGWRAISDHERLKVDVQICSPAFAHKY